MGLDEILELKFEGDEHRSGAIRDWIEGTCDKQLHSYIMGPTVQNEIADKNFRAFVAVIVGSRQILVYEVDRRGDWVSEFQLANELEA
jgi:hypothetical protein